MLILGGRVGHFSTFKRAIEGRASGELRQAAIERLKASVRAKCPPRGVLKVQRLNPRGRKGVPKTGSLRQISHGAWTAAGMTRPERVAAGGASARPPDRGHNVSRASSPGPASTSRKPPVTVSTPWCVHITSCMHTAGGAWPRGRGRPGACARGHEHGGMSDSSMWGLSTRFSLLNRTNEPKANYGGARGGCGSECKNVHRGGPHCHFRSQNHIPHAPRSC